MTTAISEQILTVLGGDVGYQVFQQSVKSAGLTMLWKVSTFVWISNIPLLSKSLRVKVQLSATIAFLPISPGVLQTSHFIYFDVIAFHMQEG